MPPRSRRDKLFARTLREADVYVDFECEQLGEVPVSRERREVRRAGRVWWVYAVRCQSGKLLELEFEPDGLPAARGGGEASYGAGVSRLLDAGDWLLLADRQEQGAPRHATGLSESRRRKTRAALEIAVAACEEIAKLGEAGSSNLSPTAARSERGRAYLAKNLTRVQPAAINGRIAELKTRLRRLKR